MAVNPTSGQSVDVQIEDLKNDTLKKVEIMHDRKTILDKDLNLDLRILSRVWRTYNKEMESFDALALPDLKGVLAKYELDQDGEASPDKVTFRIRTKDYSHTTEFDRLLVFLQYIECPILEKIRRKMIGLSEEVVLKKGLVTDLLYELALEGTDTERPLNTLSQWMYTSCFTSNKTDGQLQFKSPNSNGSFFAAVLYMLRMMGLILAARSFTGDAAGSDEKLMKRDMLRAICVSDPYQRAFVAVRAFRVIDNKRARRHEH